MALIVVMYYMIQFSSLCTLFQEWYNNIFVTVSPTMKTVPLSVSLGDYPGCCRTTT